MDLADPAERLQVAGEIGAVRSLSAIRTNLGPVRSDVNAAWDLAAHDLSIVSYWLDAEPLSATAATMSRS
jgi:predicted dehydrogenase